MVQKPNNGSTIDGKERIRRRAETRRLEILRAAARVFRRQGYVSTGMRDIAAEADLSPANLYHYFNGKHEILYFCQDRALERMLDAVHSARLSGESRAGQLRTVILAHVLCLLDEFGGSVAHLEVEALPETLRTRIIEKRDLYESRLRRIVSGGVRTGEFGRCDAQLVTLAILGAMNWTARWFRPDGKKSAQAVAESMADYLVRGIVTPVTEARDGQSAGSGGTR